MAVEHSACFEETSEDLSLQSFFPQIPYSAVTVISDTIINLFTYLIKVTAASVIDETHC